MADLTEDGTLNAQSSLRHDVTELDTSERKIKALKRLESEGRKEAFLARKAEVRRELLCTQRKLLHRSLPAFKITKDLVFYNALADFTAQ